MTTQRTIRRADGRVERTTTREDRHFVARRRRGGTGGLVVLVIGLLAVAVVGWVLVSMNPREQAETNAVADAAESGAAAQSDPESGGSMR